MGSTHGTTHGSTPEPIQTINVEPTICSLCLDRNQRVRQSVCTCNHCSLPLCSDCMGDHIDELPKNIAQLTHQLHELEKIFQSKQNMVQEEISKSTAEIKQCFKTYQNDLLEAHQAIIVDVEKAKQDAKEHLDRVSLELQAIKMDIETLAAEPIFQPRRMEALLIQLNQIQEKIQTYQMTKDTELNIVLPKYTLQFQCTPTTTTDKNELSETESSNLRDNPGRKLSRRNNFHPKTWYDYFQDNYIGYLTYPTLILTNFFTFTYDEMIFDEIERVLSITQIFHLNIIEKQISTHILIKLIILLSDLITLKLHSLLLDKFTEEERRIISKMKFQSKITNVYLEQINNIKEFNRISLLCPRMIHFKVKYINYVDINLFLRTIFIEIYHNDNYYLRSLCFHSPLADDQMVEKLDKMIHLEKLLCDYTIKRVCENIYLQWK